MNIRLYIWVRDNVHDLDSNVKKVLEDVASHCRQDEDVVALSVETIATDLGVHWRTAELALRAAVKAGYLAVEKSGHKSSPTTWRLLTSRTASARSVRSVPSRIIKRERAVREVHGLRDGLKEGGDDAPLRPNGRAPSPVENKPSPTFADRAAEEERRQAERDAAVMALIDKDERGRIDER